MDKLKALASHGMSRKTNDTTCITFQSLGLMPSLRHQNQISGHTVKVSDKANIRKKMNEERKANKYFV